MLAYISGSPSLLYERAATSSRELAPLLYVLALPQQMEGSLFLLN